MFVLPLIAVPFVLALALYRLWCIPRRLCTGEWKLVASPRRILRTGITAAAYLVLLMHTFAVVSLAVVAVFDGSLVQVQRLLFAFVAFPFVYVTAEWIMFYGLQRAAR